MKNRFLLRLSMTDLHFFKLIVIIYWWVGGMLLVACQQSSNKTEITIPLGERLVAGDANQSWISSPDGNFSFGFYVIGNGKAAVSYKLGIWYTHVPVQTIVWGLVDDNASFAVGAKLTLTSSGNLELRHSDASEDLIWSSNSADLGVGGAAFNDLGNFILLNSNGSHLWQSWNYPSDTLLPGQVMSQEKNLTAAESSHISSAGVSPYTLAFMTDGNLVLRFNTSTDYWSTDSSGGSSVSFDEFGTFQLLNRSGSVIPYRSSDYGVGPLRRLVLTSSGNLETLSWDDVVKNWTSKWQALPNVCEIYGWCGKNGLCAYLETGPVCSCLPGYQAINSNTPREGCRLMIDLNCTAGVKMVTVENTFILYYRSDFLVNSANTEICAEKCLEDTGAGGTLECLASALQNDGTAYCKETRNEFLSAYRSPFVPSQSFVKLCNDQEVTLELLSVSSTRSSSRNSRGVLVALGCVSTLAAFLVFLFAWPCLSRWVKSSVFKHSKRHPRSPTPDYVPGAPVRFAYRELQKATRNFSEKLGDGGFGTVYKGVLADGTVVAVKQLETVVDQGEREFRTEVSVIGSTHHVNLVHLHGYCTEGVHRLLVYEYLSKGSFDHYLVQGGDPTTTSSSSSSSRSATLQPPVLLDWKTRFTIALGTARGIMYLHEECRECIVHCDIKPENILLDETFCPKVSDFGLAKLLGLRNRERHITTIRGTRGYLAPEWSASLPLTAKADVYSYGMVLLELVVGRRALDDMAGESERIRFPSWVFRDMVDGSLAKRTKEQARKLGQSIDMDQFERTIFTAFWCIQADPTARPSMGKVVQMLEGIIPVDFPLEPLTIRRH